MPCCGVIRCHGNRNKKTFTSVALVRLQVGLERDHTKYESRYEMYTGTNNVFGKDLFTFRPLTDASVN